MSHHDKKHNDENPVGQDLPAAWFDIPLWQVFVTLFLIAVVLSIFKYFERTQIAPGKEVVWQTLDQNEFMQEMRRRRNIVVWVLPRNKNDQEKDAKLFQRSDIRASIYLNRCVTWTVTAEHAAEPDFQKWAKKNLSKDFLIGEQSQLFYWGTGDRKPTRLEADQFSENEILEFLEST